MSDHCQEALDKLYAYLDRELDPESVAVIKEHVDDCPPCGSAFAFEEKLLVAIRAGLREEMPQVVIERIRATIRTEIL
ncbi:MAG: zf-HC2 domain-containing protein [Acidimicrobiia bacterium]|nr:zf-HC2 domain-containing protein [Acidimicrobiia bacterium]